MGWPKCDWQGLGVYCVDGKIGYRCGAVVSDEPCPKCNGTGERDLTADEAAEYLRENNILPILDWDDDGTWYVYADLNCTKLLGEAIGFTEALNAACMAVRSKG